MQEASHLFQYENTIITRDGQVMQVAMRLTSPDVVLLDNFMTASECDALCELSKSTFTKLTEVDDATGNAVDNAIDNAHRTSLGMYFSLASTHRWSKSRRVSAAF